MVDFLDFRHLAAFREQNKSDNDLHRTGEESPPIHLHKAAKKRWRRRQKQHDLPPLKGDVKLLLASDSTINSSHQQFDICNHRYVAIPYNPSMYPNRSCYLSDLSISLPMCLAVFYIFSYLLFRQERNESPIPRSDSSLRAPPAVSSPDCNNGNQERSLSRYVSFVLCFGGLLFSQLSSLELGELAIYKASGAFGALPTLRQGVL